MSLLRDKLVRHYLLRLSVLCLLGVLLCSLFCLGQVHAAKSLLLRQNETVAGVLLRHKVPPEVIAAAFSSTTESEQGRLLLGKIGLTQDTPTHFFTVLSGFETGLLRMGLLAGLLWMAVLMLLTLYFLCKREQAYCRAAGIVCQFANGRFGCRLSQNGEGALEQLFFAVDGLATALQAGLETERRTREFLKQTISDISHQLKTPLAALQMYQEIIAGETGRPEVVAAFTRKSAASLERINGLIQMLLKITRLDAGSIHFEQTDIKIADLVRQATAELATRADIEQKELLFCGELDHTLCCDLGWTAEAISNLVKNALDHTPAGGQIKIWWECAPAVSRIFIADNGGGIAPEELHHIFKRFYRSPQSADLQGVGLGLSLAKAIIHGQGGILSVQSSLGEGAVFTISFLTEL